MPNPATKPVIDGADSTVYCMFDFSKTKGKYKLLHPLPLWQVRFSLGDSDSFGRMRICETAYYILNVLFTLYTHPPPPTWPSFCLFTDDWVPPWTKYQYTLRFINICPRHNNRILHTVFQIYMYYIPLMYTTISRK